VLKTSTAPCCERSSANAKSPVYSSNRQADQVFSLDVFAACLGTSLLAFCDADPPGAPIELHVVLAHEDKAQHPAVGVKA